MRWAAAGMLLAAVCSAQTRYLEIELSSEIDSEKVFIRYRLDNDDLGGWVQPHPGVSAYWISTLRQGQAATRIKALLYAPGCAIQTLDLPLSGTDNQKYSMSCQPLPNVTILGMLTHKDLLARREFNLEARYVSRAFDAQLITTVLVGQVATVPSDGHFKLQIPDFSQDTSGGEIQIWVREKVTDKMVAQLLPRVKLQSNYPAEIVFVPCTEQPNRVQDAFGFTLRPKDNFDACLR
jgi:hypothetical protein